MKHNTGRQRRVHLWWAAAVAVLAATALLAAACGGASHRAGPGASPSQGTAQQFAAFAQCLRSHGEPNAYASNPNASPNSSGVAVTFMGQPFTGIDLHSAQFAAAMKACKHLLPKVPTLRVTHQQYMSLLRFARCMRSHGYPAYPDPDVVNGQLIQQPLPSSIDTTSPQYQAADKTCSQGS